jgi:signal transduction histidine kinase
MDVKTKTPVLLEPTAGVKEARSLPWLGLLIGATVGFLVVHPISMLVREAHNSIYSGAPFEFGSAVLHSFHAQMWPMMMLYTVLGALVGVVLGVVLKRLKENRQRLDSLHQEFEIQVATLRHHYKNLTIAIKGFSSRVKRKLEGLEEQLKKCGINDVSVLQDYEVLVRDVTILEEASQSLSQSLGQEVMFLKALTSGSGLPGNQDFYLLLIHSIRGLLNLRFRDKRIQVEINGEPLEQFAGSMIFPFEPYAMEIILQNILSNSMKYGDHIQINVNDIGNIVRVGIKDNGPGLEVEKLKDRVLAPADRQTAESSHLG